MTENLSTEIFTPEHIQNPHPGYARVRADAAVTQVTLPGGLPAWMITRYAEARSALTDPRLVKFMPPLGFPEEIEAVMNSHMLNMDPPEHTRLRRLVSGAFTARRVAGLAPRVEEITARLLDATAGQERVNLVDALAYPLPLQVICELLGVPEAERAPFRGWSAAIGTGVWNPEAVARAGTELSAYLRTLIARHRADPGDDLYSAVIALQEGDDELTENELISLGFLLLVAGQESTAHLIANVAYVLLTHPEQRARVRDDATLLPGLVEEVLRFESPVQITTLRAAREPVEIGGVVVPAGAVVLVSLLSVNRDGRQFPDADTFDIGRQGQQHLAFGHGVHFCLGAPLARLEATIAIRALLHRYPELELDVPATEIGWNPGIAVHGPLALPVRLGRPAG